MGKAIVLFHENKLFGVFSNKSNAWIAVQSKAEDIDDLVMKHAKKDMYVPATYPNIVNRLSGGEKVHIYSNAKLEEVSKKLEEYEDSQKQIKIMDEIKAQTGTISVEELNKMNAGMVKVDPPMPVKPIFHIYQLEMNVAIDGNRYTTKSCPEEIEGSETNTENSETSEVQQVAQVAESQQSIEKQTEQTEQKELTPAI